MRKNFYILILVTVALLSGCSDKEHVDPVVSTNDGMVRIVMSSPQILQGGQLTRAAQYERMPGGSTFRLFVYKEGTGTPNTPPHKDNYVTEVTYRVLAEDEQDPLNHDRGAVLCNVDPLTGEATGDLAETDFHLPASNYLFFFVSPAIELMEDITVEGMNFNRAAIVKQGGYVDTGGAQAQKLTLYSSEARAVNLGSDPALGEGTTGIYTLTPSPFTLLTSRITFRLRPGKDVTDISVHPKGVEVERIATNPYRANFYVGTQTLAPMDVLNVNQTEGYVTITDYKEEQKQYPDPDNSGQYITAETIFFESEIVPNTIMDDTTIPYTYYTADVLIRFHLFVNKTAENPSGSYKPFLLTLSNQAFERGKSHNYDIRVNLSGLFVTGWDEDSWSTEIPN